MKLLNELLKNESCDKNVSNEGENFVINDKRTIGKIFQIISSSESSSGDNELNENIPVKCSSGICKTRKKGKHVN